MVPSTLASMLQHFIRSEKQGHQSCVLTLLDGSRRWGWEGSRRWNWDVYVHERKKTAVSKMYILLTEQIDSSFQPTNCVRSLGQHKSQQNKLNYPNTKSSSNIQQISLIQRVKKDRCGMNKMKQRCTCR